MRDHLRRTAFTEIEYFAMEAASDEKHEFIDGVIHDMAGGDEIHAAVGMNVGSALRQRLPGRPYSSDLRVWSPAARAYVYPDVTVVCGAVEKSDRRAGIAGAASARQLPP